MPCLITRCLSTLLLDISKRGISKRWDKHRGNTRLVSTCRNNRLWIATYFWYASHLLDVKQSHLPRLGRVTSQAHPSNSYWFVDWSKHLASAPSTCTQNIQKTGTCLIIKPNNALFWSLVYIFFNIFKQVRSPQHRYGPKP